MKWVWIWDALWIVGGMIAWLKRPEVPATLRLTPVEEKESIERARALARRLAARSPQPAAPRPRRLS